MPPGFSLLQLILTLAIGSILLTLAVPQWGRLTENNAIAAARSDLSAVLQLARLTAVTDQQTITLCPSSDQANCNNDYTAWHLGYILFADTDGDKSRDADEALIRVGSAGHPGVRIHSSKGRRAIRYRADGSAWGSNVTLRFCSNNHAALNRALILYGSGRLRLSDTLSNGKPVTCT